MLFWFITDTQSFSEAYLIRFAFRPAVMVCPSIGSFALDHGKWKIVNGSRYEYGTVIAFSCNPGYYRLGPAHIHCTSNGTWSWRNERPRCKSEFGTDEYIDVY